MQRLLANDTINANEAGSGPTLVLLHSLLSDRASFDRVVPELSRSHRVVVPELPGFGRSHAVMGGLAAVADRMAEAVRECAKDGTAAILGNGYGGFVALQMVLSHPDIASCAVLADCGAAFSESGRQAFHSMAAMSAEKGMAAITEIAMRRLFAPDFQKNNPELMRDRRDAFLRTDPDVFRAACEALASLDVRSQLPRVQMPVLVMVGEFDEATPPPMSRELAAGLPNARLQILPGCAHVPQLQEPALFLEAVQKFLVASPE